MQDRGASPDEEAGAFERMLSRPVPLWSLLLTLPLGIAALIGFGALVDAGQAGAVALARVPATIGGALKSKAPYYGGKHYEKLANGFWRDSAFRDEGYALISPWDPARGRTVVRLIRLSDGGVAREWVPDVDAANAHSTMVSALTDVRRDKDAARNRLMHPLLLPDGSIVVHDSSPLIRVDPCGRTLWTIDGIFNHSTEPGPDGTLWVPYRLDRPKEPGASPVFWDDTIAEVSLDGKLLKVERIADILARSGMTGLWRGRPYSDDPFHLNDIQPVFADGPHWRRGDLFLSIRNLSMVALYRPSTRKLVWWRSGPWRFQHDVTILDDRRIAIFDNRVAEGARGRRVEGHSRLLIHDLATGKTSSPWDRAFAKHKVAAIAQGLGTPLPNGDAMVEDSEMGRLMRFAPDGRLRWRYVSSDSEMRPLMLAWARYLSPSTDGPAIQAAVNAKCS